MCERYVEITEIRTRQRFVLLLMQNPKVVIATHLICVKHLVKHKGFIPYGVYNV